MGAPLSLYSLSGKFEVVRRVEVETLDAARQLVEAHIAGSGYSNLRTKTDDDYTTRFIADPPVGRKGRNVASIDL
jgi:hypothetical protein